MQAQSFIALFSADRATLGLGRGSQQRAVVVRGSAGLERPEAAQKLALLLAEAGDVDDRLGSSQHGQQAQQQALVQRIHYFAALPWIRQTTEML